MAAGELRLELSGFLLEIHAHESRSEPGEEQDQTEITEPVGDGVGQRRIGHERGLRRLVDRQLGNRAQSGAERRGLRHAAREQADGQPFVKAEGQGHADHGDQPGHRDDDGQRDLRDGLLSEAAEELRPHGVPDREQKQIEERPSQQVGQFRFCQDANPDARNQGADDVPETDPFHVKAADDVPEQNAQEETERREPVQKRRKRLHRIASVLVEDPLHIRQGAFLEERQPQQHARLLGILVQ